MSSITNLKDVDGSGKTFVDDGVAKTFGELFFNSDKIIEALNVK